MNKQIKEPTYYLEQDNEKQLFIAAAEMIPQ